ncbi:MAG: hypothetical protein HC869_16765, partial [Rhodospirillales bacterium]|nr:hypothetical protein [Rhodospirillales bacterium]
MSNTANNTQTDYAAAKYKTPSDPIGDEWSTPPEIVELVRNFFGRIDTDPASNEAAQKRIKARCYFTKADNGLNQPWMGRVFLNPPYSRRLIEMFVDKLLVELASGRAIAAILLVNNCADTAWFRKAARAAAIICFPQGRIKFIKPTRLPGARKRRLPRHLNPRNTSRRRASSNPCGTKKRKAGGCPES